MPARCSLTGRAAAPGSPRTDQYPDGTADAAADEITWCLQRVQNQRRQVQINRLLNAASLGLELFRSLR